MIYLERNSTPRSCDLYIDIPAEDRTPEDKDRIAKLQVCLYGTRDAAFQWGDRVAAQLEQNGLKTGNAFLSVCVKGQRQTLTIVHGDDYLSTGSLESPR